MIYHVLNINGLNYVIRIYTEECPELRFTQLVISGWPYHGNPHMISDQNQYAIALMVNSDWNHTVEGLKTLVGIVENAKRILFRKLTKFEGDEFNVYEVQEHSRIVSAALGN